MAARSLDLVARSILRRFPVIPAHSLPVHLGNHGGFSGARLWRVESDLGAWCLRAWPPGQPGLERLSRIHQLMRTACESKLDYVPDVEQTESNVTWVEAEDRYWEVTRWLPGQADFHARPTEERLQAVCAALAQLHRAWAGAASASGPCPAIQRRLTAYRQWSALVHGGWRPDWTSSTLDPVAHWAERAWNALQVSIDRVPELLKPRVHRNLSIQPCLCDIWHDHVLFDGNALTGIVDYGSIKMDHIAVDLARLLGSLIGDDARPRAIGIAAYRGIRPLTGDEVSLIEVLDTTGTILGAANWLKWLYHEQRLFEDRQAVAKRLAKLVERMEQRE